jgi:hypothetical protein
LCSISEDGMIPGCCSWVSFTNSITRINVQACTDGVRRRGIVVRVGRNS